ncbi:hypothetical protein B0T17DRAFT_492080 [Bombardia bombarda]|uniref:C3H1-type domain-containing protein n=1 Tax=Bombardia bombarda TaxID=252184 RepID=A0AA40C4W2_9PEZI|nr:hypothetical protein B0T17DRAFT_492080 [Bombardia bombarda]
MPASNQPEYRQMRSASLSIPSQAGLPNGMMSPMSATGRFDGPRSPPNTSHVPCKFFRQGACQAGNACPFSHDLGNAAENVCKYFAKGNCKFGPKCANIHVLPDGRRINYGKNGVTIGAPPVALGTRVNPTAYPSNSALTNSFLRADTVSPYTATSPYDDQYGHQLGHRSSMENGLPTIDTTYTSTPASIYGSPRDEDANRLGLGLSPAATKGLSVLDAPLPASFDSNGISHAARYGPWPSSVPSKFGLESPSPSLNSVKDSRTSETLKLLHTSAFGSSEYYPPTLSTAEMNGFGSSPLSAFVTHGSTLGSDEYFGKRAMHSSAPRFPKSRMMSSSAPKIDRDWEASFLFEEDYVPGALANDLLTPEEKARRGSTTNTVRAFDNLEPTSDSTPTAAASKFSSPITSGSPSRWNAFFQRQKDDDGSLDSSNASYTGGLGRPLKNPGSAFGHVGSPLRNSSLANGITAELNGDLHSGRPGPGSRQSSGSENLSALTQQLQFTRIGDEGTTSSSPHLHPNVARMPSISGLRSIGAGIIGKERDKERGLERHVSSGSIGASAMGRFTTPIDEEDSSFVFSMEDEDEAHIRARKRASGSGAQMGAASPLGAASSLGGGWSYAAAAASKNAPSAVNGGSGLSGSGAVETVGGR